MKRHIETFEDKRADGYDEFIKHWIINYEFVINSLPKLVDTYCKNAKEILVVGAGTGNEMLSLSKNDNFNITGVDPSANMISTAKEKLSKTKNTRLILGQVIDIKQTSFDVATLFLVLHFMKNDGTKEQLLKDIYNKLSDNGLFILLDIFGSKKEFKQNIKFLENLLPKELNGVDIKRKIDTMPERVFPISEKELTKLLKKVGFKKPIRFFQSAIYGGWIIMK